MPGILVSTRDQGRARVYPRPRLSRLPAGMHEKLARMITITSISILTVKHLQYALMRVTESIHRNNACSKSRWCCNCIKTPHENIMPEFRMLAFKSMQGGVHFLKAFFSLHFPILKNIQLTNISKPVQRVVPKKFEINLK